MQFLLSVVKQVSHIAVKILDQNSRAKEKFLDLETDAGEVLELEQGSYAVKRELLAGKMGPQRLPQ